MEYNIYKDMLSKMRSLVKKRLIKIPETLTAVGGGAKSPLLASYKPVLWIEQNCEVSL